MANKASIEAREVVVALGPWSDDVFRPLGYQIPLAVRRGYHMHYGVKGNATLGHSVRDADGGFTLAPMRSNALVAVGLNLDAVLERVSCYGEEANASRFGFREDAQ